MLKKILALITVLVMIFSMVGCSKTDDKENTQQEENTADTTEDTTQDTTEDTTTEEEPVVEEAPAITVGLITDTGGIDDKSFNQGTWEGIVRFQEETGASTNYLQSESDADYIPNLSQFSDEQYDLIVAPGFLFVDAITEVATNYPDQKYLIIDSVVELPNVASAVFSEEQGSFLVGIAAALKAQEAGKNTVGFLGGMDFDLIQKFEAGFEAGVKAIDPNMTVLVEYAASFSDSQIGQTLGAKMYDAGAYVIYQAAGAAGNGVIKEAKDRRTNGEDVWAIGVDKDQYADGIYDGEKSAILTSMMKRVDVAAYDVATKTAAGEFPGGQILSYSLENGGIGLPAENPNLTDDILAKVAEFEEQIKAGDITVPTVPSRLQ